MDSYFIHRYIIIKYRSNLPIIMRVMALFSTSFLCLATKKVAGYYVIPSEILSVHPSVSAPTILLPATPPTVLGQSISDFTDAFRMVWRYAYCFFQNPEITFYDIFFIFNLDFFSSPNTTEMYREYVPSARKSSYSFRPILFKLYRGF